MVRHAQISFKDFASFLFDGPIAVQTSHLPMQRVSEQSFCYNPESAHILTLHQINPTHLGNVKCAEGRDL